MPRKCSFKCKCGETDPAKFYGKGKTACAKCHNQTVIKAGQKKKLWAVNYLGGCCLLCGYNKSLRALAFHHVDSSKKDPNFSSFRGWSLERIRQELRHCVLVCHNCHCEIHDELENSV